jgi:hypothetical protein
MQIGSVVVNSRARSDEIRMILHRIEARNQANNHCTRSNTKFAPKLDSGAPDRDETFQCQVDLARTSIFLVCSRAIHGSGCRFENLTAQYRAVQREIQACGALFPKAADIASYL